MASNFWQILEKDLLIDIPDVIKNAFDICRINNAICFKNVDNKVITDVERTISDMMRKKNEHTELFYGNDSTNPLQFEFKLGHKILIKECAAHVKGIVDGNGINSGLKHFKSSNHVGNKKKENVVKIFENMGDMTESEADSKDIIRTRFFMNKLQSAVDRNCRRKKGGFRYDADVKLFASYIRLLAGPLGYQTIQNNLVCALPSLSSTNRYIQSSNCRITEGILRCEELLLYLKERDLPLIVSLSEDATRITGQVQYDRATNQLIGFTLPINEKNGMPLPFVYPARDAIEILNHFKSDNSVSTFLNVVMAQPIADVAPFCLLLYGSDNKYSSENVIKRWKHITDELSALNIQTLTIASDSDPRYNSAMRKLSMLGSDNTKINAEWFSCGNFNVNPFYIQDFIHIGTKMRNLILRNGHKENALPFGKYCIELRHLFILLSNFSKDKHELTISTLNPHDRQNFSSVKRMCSTKVISLLKNYVEKSEGTVVYLQIIQDVLESFMNVDLTPLERIRKMWYALFIIRIWRFFIVSNKKYTLKKNFLTSYCYSCLELNAHSLVLCILYLKEHDSSQLFLTHLYDSQPCESMFRQFRSFTPTFSTVINCTVKEALSRITKTQLMNEIAHTTSKNFTYPKIKQQINSKEQKFCELPSQKDIIDEIEKCKRDAIAAAKKLGLITNTKSKTMNFCCGIKPYITTKCMKLKKMGRMNQNSLSETQIVLPDLKNIVLKDFGEKFVKTPSATSPYIEVIQKNGRRLVVKKTSLCWLLRKESKKMSNDRLYRVRFKNVENTKSSSPKRRKKKYRINPLYKHRALLKRRKINKYK